MKFLSDFVRSTAEENTNLLDFYNVQTSKLQDISTWPLLAFFCSAVFCMGCSAIYHLCYVISPHVMSVLSRLDYAGISILIAGSSYPPCYYIFYCEFNWVIFYLSILSLSGLICFTLTLIPSFYQPQWRGFRAVLFVCYGFLTFPLMVHSCFQDQHIGMIRIFVCVACQGAVYCLGALVYVQRIPEKLFPG